MLDSLLGWFTAREQNRRRFPRRRTPYLGRALLSDGNLPFIGVDASAGGICILFQRAPSASIFDVLMKLESEILVRARVEIVWSDRIIHRGKAAVRIGARFVGIAADDWDRIFSWAGFLEASNGNVAHQELIEVRMAPEDVDRLLPKAVQDVMLSSLIQSKRLFIPSPGIAPLVQYFYSGIIKRKGQSFHRVVIESRIPRENDQETLKTTFLVNDAGQVFLQPARS